MEPRMDASWHLRELAGEWRNRVSAEREIQAQNSRARSVSPWSPQVACHPPESPRNAHSLRAPQLLPITSSKRAVATGTLIIPVAISVNQPETAFLASL